MENIGIDLGSKVSQVCVRNGVGVIVEEKRCRSRFLLLPAAPGLWSHVGSRLAEGCPQGRNERTASGA